LYSINYLCSEQTGGNFGTQSNGTNGRMPNVRRAARGQISGGFFIEWEKGKRKMKGEKVGAMKNRYLLFFYILFTMIFSLNSPAALSGTATLAWDAPTTNADGTPLTDLAGYMVYYGNSPGNYSQNMNVDNVTTYTVNNLTDGLTYYFAVTAYDTSGNESGYSNELSKTLPSPQYTLTINKDIGDNGTVTSSPVGINCGSVCSEVYNAGTVVTLTASFDAGSAFAGWSGGGCTGTGQCVFTMNANKSITATFIPNTYLITSTAGIGGTILPSDSVSIDYGTDKTFTITPNTNYHVADVLVDGNSVGTVTSYTFNNVTANHTISATFAINTYTVTPSAAGTGGSLSPSTPQTVNYNQTTSFTVTPNTGYSVASVTGCGGTLLGNTYTTGPITGNCTVTATFAINTYTITASAGASGSIAPSGAVTVNYGASQTFTITPNANYHVADVQVDGSSLGAVTSYTFNNVTANHTINATFAINSVPMHTITASAGANGTIFPSGVLTVNDGASQSFTITPNASYHIADVQADSSSVGPVTSYTFTNVTANHTISASFAMNTYILTVTKAGTGTGTVTSSPTGINCGSVCSEAYNAGTVMTLTALPDTNCTFTGWSGGCSGTGTCFLTIDAAKTVAATFTLKTYTITATAETGGSISPSGMVPVNYGANQTFAIMSNNGYRILDVKIDGSSVGAVSAYTFGNVTNNHKIEANFVKIISKGRYKHR